MANYVKILFKGLREEDEEGEEGFLDWGENLKEIKRSLLMVDNNKALNRLITHVGPILEALANGRKAHDSMGKRMGTGYLHIIQEMVEQHSTDPKDTKADRLEVDHTSGSSTSAEMTKMGLVGQTVV